VGCGRYGTYSTIEALTAGLDLEMPGGTLFRGKLAELAVSSNAIKTSVIDKRALRVLEFIDQASQVEVSDHETERNRPEDRELNRRLAQNSIVLLKNDRNVLPLSRQVRKIALIGSHMKDVSTYATGATALEPYYSIHPFDAIVEKLPADVEYRYEIGAYTHKMLPLLGERLISGLGLDLFNECSSIHDRQRIARIPMNKTYFQLLDYVNLQLNSDEFYGSLEGNFIPDESGVWVFGMAVHGTAKLLIDDELVIDNTLNQQQGDTFFRQGTIEMMGDKLVQAGQTYKLRVDFGSASTSPLREFSDGSIEFPGGGVRLGACLKIDPQAAIDWAVEAAKGADVVVICTGLNVRESSSHRIWALKLTGLTTGRVGK
jgi:beta-glucosidase